METTLTETKLQAEHAPVQSETPAPLSGSRAAAQFQASFMEHAGHLKTRLAIVQGKGEDFHMYVAYLDLDGVWRTMDMYMGIADRPGGPAV